MVSCSRGGLINAHTHLYSGLVSLGFPPLDPKPRNFLEILERLWWRLDRALEPETLRAAARFYLANALLCGTTTLLDHHESPEMIEGSLDILADACEELGMRALLCYGVTERNGGRKEAEAGLSECQRFIETNTRSLVKGAIGIHASFTVSDETLREAGALSRRLSVPVHVHLAEDQADVDDAKRRGYAGPLERLLELEALPPSSIVAHGVCLSEAEVALAADSGLWLVQNPRSNEGNGVGFAASLGQSARAALGTDGYPSDMNAESEALMRLAEEHGVRDASLLPTLRQEASLRLVEEVFGALDDRVDVLDGSTHNVTVAGREIVREGELVSANLSLIRQEAAQSKERLFSRYSSIGGKT